MRRRVRACSSNAARCPRPRTHSRPRPKRCSRRRPMMAEGDLFRQAALDRLASPEQLHTLMKVTDAKGWLALLGCGVLLASALCWGVFGSVPTKLQASGILIHSAGLADVVGLGAGQVTSIDVDAGDFVRKGQVIAHLGQPEIEQELAG